MDAFVKFIDGTVSLISLTTVFFRLAGEVFRDVLVTVFLVGFSAMSSMLSQIVCFKVDVVVKCWNSRVRERNVEID